MLPPISPIDDARYPKAQKSWQGLNDLIAALNAKDLDEGLREQVEALLRPAREASGSDKERRKRYRKVTNRVLALVQKQTKLVPRNYHRDLWMSLGLAVFGVPIGIAMGSAMDNMGLMGAFMPIGLAIGLAVGAGMDKQAQQQGLQLDFPVEKGSRF